LSLGNIYLALALMSALGTLTAIVRARRVYLLAPLYFFSAWLTGELALIHILWQVILTGFLSLAGAFGEASAQWGLAIFSLSWIGLLYLHCQAMDSSHHLGNALREGLGGDYRVVIPAERQGSLQSEIRCRHWLQPFRFAREGVVLHRDIAYSDGGKRQLLDIYQPTAFAGRSSPVLLQVHGGGWVIGAKEEQAKPLIYHMAERGWLCVAINYRLSPRVAFPAHIIDVKKAIAWIRENIGDYGGDPDFIAITGGSAGGHLSSLAALTPNRPEWQPGFEAADTSLQAAVPFYGVYDLLDREGIRKGMSMAGFLEKKVLQASVRQNPDLWDTGSPISHVGPAAPPTFVVQGTHDTLVWVEEARHFVTALRAVASQPVVYAELPGAQHAFEVFHSVRTDHTVNAVGDFLEWTHARWRDGRRPGDEDTRATATTCRPSVPAESPVQRAEQSPSSAPADPGPVQ
jgi:acetyl esterase/lipase